MAKGTADNREDLADDFLDELLWVDPCADAIWTEPDLGDGRFNPIDRGYRDVALKRAQFLGVQREGELSVAHGKVATAPVLALDDRGPTDSQIESSKIIKRKTVRTAPWAKHLRKYLRLRHQRNDDILLMSLKEIRVDFIIYAMHNGFRDIPRARSSIEDQIKKVRLQVVAEHQKHRQRDYDATAPSMDEITSMTDPSRWKR